MRRWITEMLVLVGLAVACTAAALWVRSKGTRDYFVLVDRMSTGETSFNADSVGVQTVNGCIHLYYDFGSYSRQPAHRPSYRGFEHYSDPITLDSRPPFFESAIWWSRRGFSAGRPVYSNSFATFAYGGITLPAWFVVLMTGWPAAVLYSRKYACHRRKKVGHCSNCGYDLRATPDRCPECGTLPAQLPA